MKLLSRRPRMAADHFPPFLRRFSTQSEPSYGSETQPTPSPPQQHDESVVIRALQLLRGPEKEWSLGQLRSLLFSDSPPSPRTFLHIARRLSCPNKAFHFLRFLQTNSPSPNTDSVSASFQAVLELSSRKSDSPDELMKLWKQSQELGVPLTASAASLLLRCFGRAGMVDQSVSLFYGLDPSVRNTQVCNKLIHALFRWNRFRDALKVLDEMLQRGSEFPPDEATGKILFPALLKRQPSGSVVSEKKIVGLVLEFFAHGVFPDAVAFTELISKLCRGGKCDLAWDVLHGAMKFGGRVETAYCNALLTGLGKNQDLERMNILMEEMKEMDVQPNVVTFGILINFMCKSGMLDGALELLEKMRLGEDKVLVPPDVIMYNTLIDGLCRVGRQEEGLGLMKQMRLQSGCAPNHVTYNSLVGGLCRAGEIERAQELLNEMKSEGLQPDVVTLNTLVNGMCMHGRTNSALEFFDEMQQKGLKGDVRTYTPLIKAYCSVNNIDKAWKLFDTMVSQGHSPDAIAFYTLISGFSQARRMDDALLMATKCKEAGFHLDIVCFNTLISGFCKKKKLDQAYELLKEMEKADVKPDCVTYNTLISCFSKTGDLATVKALWEEMVNSGLQPNDVTYGSLIHACCLHGKCDEGVQILKNMSSASRVKPNTVMYNIVIDSLCKNGKVDLALLLMADMKVKGVRPNTTTYNAMLKGFREKNLLEETFTLMDKMAEQGCEPDLITMEILTEWLPEVGETQRLKDFVLGYETSASPARSGVGRG